MGQKDNEVSHTCRIITEIQVCRSRNSDPSMWYKNLDGSKFTFIYKQDCAYIVYDDKGKVNVIYEEDGIEL